MSLPLSEIARLIEGNFTGSDVEITGAATLPVARPGEITLADHPKLAPKLARSEASAVIVPATLQPTDRPYITVNDVHAAFAKIVAHFHPPRQTHFDGISPAAYVHPTARVAAGTEIHPQAFVGAHAEIAAGCIIHSGVRILDGCRIGEGCTLFPNVVLYENTILGQQVIIHAGAVLGAYGFGYNSSDGRHKLCSQLGHVEVGDQVEIGAGTTIDRGTYGPTVIGSGTKIDNLVQIGHNCRLGRHNLICSQVGIAGSCTTGEYVVMAGQVGLADHLHIGDGAMLGAKCGVMTDVPPGKRYLGAPAVEERQFFRSISLIQQLPEIRRQLHEAQRAIIRLAGERGDAEPHADAA
ncbi:MAG: UDP-3-O-(3-hydroxymyristoyl)glucosamine N-acyltransferase [Planctomycetia bacterium]|jgi:UDP-3-O-[3-hydroxymyristoyl] glucosamine N-acyltransferase|nr:UDP-3-O-(3-hydroxymyristoyl)glucosamine N-acyltransferase [Planctomycetia bacterium]